MCSQPTRRGWSPWGSDPALPAADNTAIAAKLELAADLLEISGAEKFRVLSYRKAADAIRSWPEQVAALANEGRLTEIPGVGAKMAANVEQVVRTGSFEALDELAASLPVSLATVMRVSGVGPKRAAQLYTSLGVSSVDDLEAALADGRVERLGGFGPRSAAAIARGVEAYRRHLTRMPIGDALPVAEQLSAELSVLPGTDAVDIAGSVRRREETVGDIDILVVSAVPERVLDEVADVSAVEGVLKRDATGAVAALHDGFRVDVHVAAPEERGPALVYATGSAEHLDALRRRAGELGLKLDEHGVWRIEGGRSERLAAATEADVYGLLGMQTPAPELRWGAEEIEQAVSGTLPEFVTLSQVRGDLQSHSTYTDGRNSLAEMRQAAAARGYEYIAATDHAWALRMVGGLSVDDLRRQWHEIDELNADASGPRVLKGIELNIAEDGRLDYDDDVLARFDIVLASLHSGWDQDEKTATARLLAAIENPWVDVIAHPTGRIIGKRDPIRLDMDAVLAAAGETGTIMEINSYPDRLDLSAEHVRLARSYGVRFSLGTDAHAAEQLAHMRFGVDQARRGAVTADELLNAHPWEVARTWLKRARLL